MKRRVVFSVVLGFALGLAGSAFGQEKFPTRPLNLIISWTAGGGQDLTARAIQPHLEKALGQSVIIVNKPGGGGSIGFNEVANAAPDGYTFGQFTPSLSVLKYTMNAAVDYAKYEPILYGGYSPAAILARQDAPWNNLKEFIDYARGRRVKNEG